MTAVTVELPSETERTLRERAAASGLTLEVYLRRMAEREAGGAAGPPVVSSADRLLDSDYHAECEADTSPDITLDEVRTALAKIPGCMTADFIAERDER
jgi:hypothetical protein